MQLDQWLEQNGLAKYAPLFAEHDVDLEVLPLLRQSDVDRLGLPTGARRRLLAAIAALGGEAAPPASAAAAPASPSAERRQLTVLFCDLCGSTQLSRQLDPDLLKALMASYQKACRSVVERYEGSVAEYLSGEIMAYFGWPRAHEDDAERALRAGLDLVSAVKNVSAPSALQVRIGVASGAVVVGEGSEDPSASKLAVGETPNISRPAWRDRSSRSHTSR